MKKIYISIVTLSLLILLSGCGATGKQFDGFTSSKNNKGTVYVYRPLGFTAVAINYKVDDITRGKDIGKLRNGGYLKYETNPGKIKIKIIHEADADIVAGWLLVNANAAALTEYVTPSNIYNLDIKTNDTICIRWDAVHTSTNGIVDKKTCRQEIAKLKQSGK